LLHGSNTSSIHTLQSVQNNAARIVLQAPRRCHANANPLLRQLHWLPVRHRINYKLAVMTYKIHSHRLNNHGDRGRQVSPNCKRQGQGMGRGGLATCVCNANEHGPTQLFLRCCAYVHSTGLPTCVITSTLAKQHEHYVHLTLYWSVLPFTRTELAKRALRCSAPSVWNSLYLHSSPTAADDLKNLGR